MTSGAVPRRQPVRIAVLVYSEMLLSSHQELPFGSRVFVVGGNEGWWVVEIVGCPKVK